jgi:hypothetical protein
LDNQTLPGLAAALRVWFPMLEGRAIEVADVEEVWSKEQLPKLPVCIVGLVSLSAEAPNHTNAPIDITEHIDVVFHLTPSKIRSIERSTETPFWSYYNYPGLMNRLIAHLQNYKSEIGGRVVFKSLTQTCDAYCVTLSMRVEHNYLWCLDAAEPELQAEIQAQTYIGTTKLQTDISAASLACAKPCNL